MRGSEVARVEGRSFSLRFIIKDILRPSIVYTTCIIATRKTYPFHKYTDIHSKPTYTKNQDDTFYVRYTFDHSRRRELPLQQRPSAAGVCDGVSPRPPREFGMYFGNAFPQGNQISLYYNE